MSNFLKYLLFESLFASGILIIAKIIGLIGGLWITGTQFSLGQSQNIFPTLSITIADPTQLYVVNSLSNAIFMTIVIIFATATITRIYFSQIAEKNEKLVAKIIYYNLFDWMESGEHIYPKLFTWIIYLWLATILVLRDAISASAWVQIPLIAIIFASVYSIIIFLHLDRHIEIISFHRNSNGSHEKITAKSR